jgi:type IV secretory pathway VirB10-like protein
MLARATIVLLLILNLGVATWWATRREPAPQPAQAEPPSVLRLQLLHEVPARPRQRPQSQPLPDIATPAVATSAPTPAQATVAKPERCYAFGPFEDAAKVAAARAQLQSQVQRMRVRDIAAASARGWRVWMPPLPDRAAAQAMVMRIGAAGFNDYFIVANGSEANGIALGRYRSETAARQREAALQAGGFATAHAEALGQDKAQTWIDVAVPAAFATEAARSAVGAGQAKPIDCRSVAA